MIRAMAIITGIGVGYLFTYIYDRIFGDDNE